MQKTHVFIQELPLPDEGFGVWCAVNASGIIGSSLLSDQKLSPLCNAQSESSSCPNARELTPFYSARLCKSSLRRKQLRALFCVMCSSGRVIQVDGICDLRVGQTWISAVAFYMWGVLKDKMCSNDRGAEDNLKKVIQFQRPKFDV
jgi:hypothetical protein